MFLPQYIFNIGLAFAHAALPFSNGSIAPLVLSTNETVLFTVNIVKTGMILGGFCFGIYVYKTHILRAVRSGDLGRVKSSVYWGADVNSRNNCGLTPLHVAVSHNLLDILKFLLHENAQTKVLDCQKNTVLDYALKEKNNTMLVCLSFNHAHSYNMHSEYLTDETKNIFTVFRMYESDKKIKHSALFQLLTSNALTNISYNKKLYDGIGFGLGNCDHKGLEYCKENKLFDNEEILMAIADNKQLAKFVSCYLEKINLNTWDQKKICTYAKKQDNLPFAKALKLYSSYFKALQETKFRKKFGDAALIQKVLSYVDCDLE